MFCSTRSIRNCISDRLVTVQKSFEKFSNHFSRFFTKIVTGPPLVLQKQTYLRGKNPNTKMDRSPSSEGVVSSSAHLDQLEFIPDKSETVGSVRNGFKQLKSSLLEKFLGFCRYSETTLDLTTTYMMNRPKLSETVRNHPKLASSQKLDIALHRSQFDL